MSQVQSSPQGTETQPVVAGLGLAIEEIEEVTEPGIVIVSLGLGG